MSAFVIHTIEFLPVVSSVNSSDFFLNKPSSIYRVLLIRTSLITLVSDCVLLTYSSESSLSILTQISPAFPISSSFSACSGSRVWTLAAPSLPLYQTRGTHYYHYDSSVFWFIFANCQCISPLIPESPILRDFSNWEDGSV